MSDKSTDRTHSVTYTEKTDHALYWIMVCLILEILDPRGKNRFCDPEVVLEQTDVSQPDDCSYKTIYIDPGKCRIFEHLSSIVDKKPSNLITFQLATNLSSIQVSTPLEYFKKHTDAATQMKLLIKRLHWTYQFLMRNLNPLTMGGTAAKMIQEYLSRRTDTDRSVSYLSEAFITLYSNLEILLEDIASGKMVALIDCLASRQVDRVNPKSPGMEEFETIRKERLAGSRIFVLPRRPFDAMNFQPYAGDGKATPAFWHALRKMDDEMGFPGQEDNPGLATKILQRGSYLSEPTEPDLRHHEILVFKPALAEMTIYSSNPVNTAYMLLYILNRAAIRDIFLKVEDITTSLPVCKLDDDN